MGRGRSPIRTGSTAAAPGRPSICRTCAGRGHVVAPTTAACPDCGGRGVRHPEARRVMGGPVAAALAPLRRADERRRGLAQVMRTPRTIVHAAPRRPCSRYGQVQADGSVRFPIPCADGETQPVVLRPDGAVVYADGAVHDPGRVRRSWLRAGHDAGPESVALDGFAAARPLSWHEQEALLDYLSLGRRLDEELVADPEHLDDYDHRRLRGLRRELEGAIAARPLPDAIAAWWAPRPDLTGVADLPEPANAEPIDWPAPLVCSLGRPAAASGPVYRLSIPSGTPALWSVPEAGSAAGDHLLLSAGRRISPLGLAPAIADGSGVVRRTVIARLG